MYTKIQDYFSDIADPRQAKKCSHLLSDILLIGLCSYLSNGEDYEDMVLFGQTKAHLLPDFFSLPNGVPSHDTFNRVFQLIDPKVLGQSLQSYGKDIVSVLAEKQICIDGKKLKGVSPKSRGNKGFYLVNAWVSENRLCVGQAKVQDKHNEIMAIPQLLKEIDIQQAVVTIDAIGCQKEIATQIKEQQGHYLLAVKGNQRELLDEISCAFKSNPALSVHEDWEYAGGRFENRKCSILSACSSMDEQIVGKWEGLQTIVKLEAIRQVEDKTVKETRYYISDEIFNDAAYFNKLSRGHWGIENQFHWHLDVTFKEDSCRARTGNAPENLSTLRKLALQMINEMEDKLSLKKRRVKAAWDVEYLKKILS